MIELVLPFPPSVNHYWERCGRRTFVGKRGIEFREKTAEAVSVVGKKLSGRLSVFVRLFPPTRQKRDIDNSMKSLLDALQHAGCYDDDEQIDVLHVERGEVVKGGMCKVVVIEHAQ